MFINYLVIIALKRRNYSCKPPLTLYVRRPITHTHTLHSHTHTHTHASWRAAASQKPKLQVAFQPFIVFGQPFRMHHTRAREHQPAGVSHSECYSSHTLLCLKYIVCFSYRGLLLGNTCLTPLSAQNYDVRILRENYICVDPRWLIVVCMCDIINSLYTYRWFCSHSLLLCYTSRVKSYYMGTMCAACLVGELMIGSPSCWLCALKGINPPTS